MRKLKMSFPLLIVLLSQIIVSWSALPPNITIGGLFDESDGGSYSASELAFNLAINDVNADSSILTGVSLTGISNTTSPLDIKQSVDSVCEQLAKGAVAIIGPARSTVVKTTNYICSGIGLPQITYAATDRSLFTGHQQYPYLIRLSSSGDRQSDAILALMQYYKWTKAGMLTSSDDYGAVSLQHLRQAAFEKKISIVKTAVFPALSNASLVDLTSPLLTLRSVGVRVVILSCPGKYSRRVLDLASSLGMMTSGWVWIVSDAIATEANLYNSSAAVPVHLQGILGIVPSSAQMQNRASFEAKWTVNGGQLPISVYSYKVYDAVWTVARALQDMATNGDNLSPPSVSCVQCHQDNITRWADGETLLQKIKTVQFTGQLHPIEFDDDGSLQYQAYDFVNLQNTGFQKVGHWENSSGLALNASDIVWLGNTEGKPLISSNSLKNKTFKIVTIAEPPFTMKKVGNYTGNDLWEGYCIDMLKQIAKELEFNYVLHGSYDGKFGGKNADTQEWDGMVNELTTGQADMAFAAFTISSVRQEVIDFTIPYIDLGLGVIIKKKASEKGLLAFMDPFTNDVWFLLFCSTMYVGFLISVCSKLSPYGYHGATVQTDPELLSEEAADELRENKDNMKLDEAAWFSMGSLLGQGTDHQPRPISGKVVAAVWWMTGTIFVSTYTANLAAFLTISKSAISVRSVEDLAAQDTIKYGTVMSTQPSQFFERSNIPLYQKMWSKMKAEDTLVEASADGFARVQEGNYAFIWDSAVLEYVINQQPCNTFMLNDIFSPLGYGVGLPLNSPYKDAISNEILKLRENGFLDKLKSEWFVQKGMCGTGTTTSSTVVTVQQADVLGVYLLVTGGVVLGFIALILEWIYFTRKLVKSEDSEYQTYREAFKARLKLMWRDMTSRWISRRTFLKKDQPE